MWRIVVFLSWVLPVVQAVHQTSTGGNSGPQCGNHRCLAGNVATCDEGKCECRRPGHGIGHFVCAEPNEHFCAIFNDPMVRGFDVSHTKVPLCCKFLAAHVRSKVCRSTSPVSVSNSNRNECDVRVYAWGSRKLGKTFVRGVQVHIIVAVNGQFYHHSTRIYTVAFNGQYMYSEDGNDIPFGAGPFTNPVTTNIPGVGRIHTVYDQRDNFGRLIVESCGIEVGIRGVELQLQNSLLMPAGAYIKVLDDCEPDYLSNHEALCSPPAGKGMTLEEHAQTISDEIGRPVTPEMVGLIRALTSEILQDFPDAPFSAQILSDTTRQCDMETRVEALTYCSFIIGNPPFFNCMDKTDDGDQALALLDKCIFSICDFNSFMCDDIKTLISESKCVEKIEDGEETILDHDCNFF